VARGRRRETPQQFAVVGVGRFGSSVARTLCEMGHEVLVIDQDEERVQNLADSVTHAVEADATDEGVMRSLGMRNFDVAIVAIGDIQASILTTLILKDVGVTYIVAKAVSDLHGKVLAKVGADEVVFPERDMGVRVAHNLVSAHIIDYIELVPGYSIVEVIAHKDFAGKSLKDLDLRAKYGINIVAIKRGEDVRVAPGAEDAVQEGDILVAMGEDHMLDKLESGES